MSLNYNILWIEDNPKTIQSKLRHIKDFLAEEGFGVNDKVLEDGEDIEKFLVPELDLIITDYNIHDKLDGKQLAEKVRGLDALVDIILYSQQGQIDLYDVVGTLDGVYISNRDGLEEKIIEVIKITIRRTQSVNNMRGIVISEAIDIENQIEDAVLLYHTGKEKELASDLLNGNDGIDFGKKIGFLNRCLNQMQKNYNIAINGGAKGKAKIKAENLFKCLAPLILTSKKLEKEVCRPRNMLAHVEQQVNDKGMPYLKSMDKEYKEIQVNSDWYKNTRKILQKHSNNLNQIIEFIKNQLNS